MIFPYYPTSNALVCSVAGRWKMDLVSENTPACILYTVTDLYGTYQYVVYGNIPVGSTLIEAIRREVKVA